MGWKAWLRIGLATIAGGIGGNVAAWGHATLGGEHVAFTAGNIIVTAIPGILTTLLGLFARRPQDTP